jgi:hypothetical protein
MRIDPDFVRERITTPAAAFLLGCEQSLGGWREFGCACASPAYRGRAPPRTMSHRMAKPVVPLISLITLASWMFISVRAFCICWIQVAAAATRFSRCCTPLAKRADLLGWAEESLCNSFWHHLQRPPCSEIITSMRSASSSAFYEKAGMSQVFFSFFFFLPVDSFRSSRAASVAILPSALLVERFSLGAWWAFPIQ